MALKNCSAYVQLLAQLTEVGAHANLEVPNIGEILVPRVVEFHGIRGCRGDLAG